MKKITIVLGIFSLVALGSCSGETPQEKAQKESEKALDKAEKSNEEGEQAAVAAMAYDAATVIYTDIAAANAAVAQVSMPALSNDKAKNLASDLVKSLVDRINAKDANQAKDSEKKISEYKDKAEKEYQDGKITVEDRDAIMKYYQDCVNAAMGTIA